MIPAPDAFRCDERHPHNSLWRCFKVTHAPTEIHVHEEPSTSETYHCSVVRQWYSPGFIPVSEFAEGPYVTVDITTSAPDAAPAP